MTKEIMESVNIGKCRRAVNLATLLLENRRECFESEIMNLDYHEAMFIVEEIRESEETKDRYSCQLVPVVNIDSYGDSYKIIIRRK